MTLSASSTIIDQVPADSEAAREIGFAVPLRYNACRILFDNLPARRDKAAVIGPMGRRSYGELCAEAAQWGHGFRALGLSRGDRILMFLDDTPAYPAAFFGAVRAGLVPLLINTLTPPDLLQFYLADSAAAVAVADAEFTARFDATACTGTQLRCLIVANGAAQPHAVGETLLASNWLPRFPTTLEEADTDRNDMAFWMYSSGSTGRPKGIVHLQHDMAFSNAAYAKHVLKLTPDDICFSVPKLFFAYGFGNSVTFPFCAGATSLLQPGQPKPQSIFAAISAFRPTVFFGLPTLYTALTKADGVRDCDFSSLRLSLSAAEVLAAEVFNGWKRLTGLEIVEGLGSTEALHIYLSNLPERKKTGAAGLRVPGYEIVLKDRDGQPAGPGEEGILWVRGDSNAPLYWNRPDKTAETMREDGWILTGDRFHCDAEGFYFFRGRADDLVKISGQWVYPLEIELCLADHPDVLECAVFATELADRRMTLQAVVAMKQQVCDPAAARRLLQNYVKTKLLPYKYPREIMFLEELPKTGTGKIDRQGLLKAIAASVPDVCCEIAPGQAASGGPAQRGRLASTGRTEMDHAVAKTPERDSFYRQIDGENLSALWNVMGDLITREPKSPCRPHLWRYQAIRHHMMEAGRLITAKEAERRVLILENPGLRGQSKITTSLYAGVQMVTPGEVAPAHRHSQSALRFILEGKGAHTAVDGERTIMAPGDFVITPARAWHDHGNETSEPMLWLDGLDIPMVQFFDASFIEGHGEDEQPITRPAGDSFARYGHNLLPVDFQPKSKASPVFNYPYEHSRAALDTAKRSSEWDPCHGLKLRYTNPVSGESPMPTVGTFIQLLPKDFHTERYRSTDATVFTAVEGRGRSRIGDEVFDWGPRDIFVVPSWHWVTHEADEEAVLFSFSDRPVQQKLDLFREDRGNV